MNDSRDASVKTAQVSKTLVSGSLWTALGEVVDGLASLATSIIAARILVPNDFGTMRIVVIAMTLLEHLSQSGFDSALVHRRDGVDRYLDVAWTWHLIRGLVICALLWLAAPFVARFYDQPVLTPLFMVCAAAAVLRGASNVGVIFFARQLDFRRLFWIRIGQTMLRIGVFIPAIFWFRNVWALSASFIGGALAQMVISYVSHPYRPKLRWDPPRLRELIRYGKWLTWFAAIGFVIAQGDDLFVSKYFGLAALGFYQLAYDISNLPTTHITHVLGRIGMPVYSSLQHDTNALRFAVLRMLRSTMLLSGPVTVLLWTFIPDIISHILGSKWEPTIVLVRVLVLSGLVRAFVATAGPLFQAVGRPDLDFKMNLPRFVATVVLIWPFSAWWGLVGACYVVLTAIVAALPLWLIAVPKLSGITLRDVLHETRLAILASILLAACFYLLRPLFGSTSYESAGALASILIAWGCALAVVGRFTSLDFFAEVRKIRRVLKS